MKHSSILNKTYISRFIVVVVFLCTCSLYAKNKNTVRQIKIITGAESHGMVDACDCEVEPGGGVAKRASLLATLGSRDKLLLLDAGGFAAGGIYDDYSQGRKADSLRTIAMIAAMGMMGYDAVAIGDDDLQYGGKWLLRQAKKASLPLVCANCFLGDKKPLAQPWTVVKKEGVTIGITALCTVERLFPIAQDVTITDPIASLKNIWKKMVAKTDIQIILSHLGEEEAHALVKNFPKCDLIVNGHRKIDTQPVTMVGKIPMMQFGFQGKSLSSTILKTEGEQNTFFQSRWYDIGPELQDDPQVMDLMHQLKVTEATPDNHYDLYIMSQCPYGRDALSHFLQFIKNDPSVQWNIRFIGTVDNDTVLSSLHGSEEVHDEKVWLAIQSLYPENWIHFLKVRVSTDEQSIQIAEKLGFDISKINRWIAVNGSSELQKQYFRSMRLSVDASPTLLINNHPFGKDITTVHLQRFQCSTKDSTAFYCDSLPECDDDSECRSPGKLGRCVNESCEYREAVAFDFTVLITDSTIAHPERKIIQTTRDLFPGAKIQTVTMSSKRGKALVKKYQPRSLPFYLFGQKVSRAYNFSKIESGLVNIGEAYTFQHGIIPSNYFPQRDKKQGALQLFIDPFFQGLPDIFSILFSDSLTTQQIVIRPIILTDPATPRPGTEEWFRQEEALRWIALGKISPDKKTGYLKAYSHYPGSSWWHSLLIETGISPKTLQTKASQSTDDLRQLRKTLESLAIRGGAVLLIDNVETVELNGERELRRVLARHLYK